MARLGGVAAYAKERDSVARTTVEPRELEAFAGRVVPRNLTNAERIEFYRQSDEATIMNDAVQTIGAESELLALEHQRCEALQRGDFSRLREILHPQLTHTHSTGRVDNYASYFAGGGTHVIYTQVERSDMNVRIFGDVAVMDGRQLMVAVRKNGTGTVRIDSRVLQVWVVDAGKWRQLAFQTTPTEMSVA